jgi:O-antigen/teichoic acid export membrane protein
VITLCIAFLFTALFLDFWKHLNPSTYWDGLKVVPLLLLANVFLGIYYNLIAALKISNNMDKITYITIIGAMITVLINITFIPQYGMMACAWATLICYFLMMILAYGWGQMYYPIKYPRRRIATYLMVMLLSYAIQRLVIQDTQSLWAEWLSAVVLFFSFIFLIVYLEKEQLKRLPIIGRFIA